MIYGCGESVIQRILTKNSIPIRSKTTRYTLDINIFDIIDSEDKAYWIGFLWCDGYNAKRIRKGNVFYEFKLSLKHDDINHIVKLKSFLKSNHEIKKYKYSSNFGEGFECRLLIANSDFGRKLDYEYGLVPNRFNCEKLLSKIPDHLFKHFVRGVLDADGSIIYSLTHDRSRVKNGGKEYVNNKAAVTISSYKELITYINEYLEINKIINVKSKIYQRHKDRDGECRAVKYCGNINALTLLDWLYKDSTIYLDRKYSKYIKIKNELQQ